MIFYKDILDEKLSAVGTVIFFIGRKELVYNGPFLIEFHLFDLPKVKGNCHAII